MDIDKIKVGMKVCVIKHKNNIGSKHWEFRSNIAIVGAINIRYYPLSIHIYSEENGEAQWVPSDALEPFCKLNRKGK